MITFICYSGELYHVLDLVPWTFILHYTGTLFTEYSDMAAELNLTWRFCFCQFVILSLYEVVPGWFGNVDSPHARVHLMLWHVFWFACEWSLSHYIHNKSSRACGTSPVQLLTLCIRKQEFLSTLSTYHKRRVWDSGLGGRSGSLMHHVNLTDGLSLPNVDSKVERWWKYGKVEEVSFVYRE